MIAKTMLVLSKDVKIVPYNADIKHFIQGYAGHIVADGIGHNGWIVNPSNPYTLNMKVITDNSVTEIETKMPGGVGTDLGRIFSSLEGLTTNHIVNEVFADYVLWKHYTDQRTEEVNVASPALIQLAQKAFRKHKKHPPTDDGWVTSTLADINSRKEHLEGVINIDCEACDKIHKILTSIQSVKWTYYLSGGGAVVVNIVIDHSSINVHITKGKPGSTAIEVIGTGYDLIYSENKFIQQLFSIYGNVLTGDKAINQSIDTVKAYINSQSW